MTYRRLPRRAARRTMLPGAAGRLRAMLAPRGRRVGWRRAVVRALAL